MTRTFAPDVAIVGGGPSGLLLGALLSKLGVTTAIIERGSAGQRPPAEVCPMLQPVTLRTLRLVGLLDECTRRSPRISRAEVYMGSTLMAKSDLSEVESTYPAFAAPVPIRDIRESLTRVLRASEHVSIHYDCTSRVVKGDDGRFSLIVEQAGLNEDFSVTPKLLVASDGKGSKTRPALGIHASTMTFPSGYVELRVPRSSNTAGLRIISRTTPHGYFFSAPMPSDQQMIVWIRAEDGRPALPPATIIEAVSSGVPEIPKDHVAKAAASATVWPHAIVRPSQWVRQNGVLLGDSAHGMHAYGGQGLNFSLQDCALLAAEISSTGATIQSALGYESARRPFVLDFQKFQETGLTHLADPSAATPLEIPSLSSLTMGPPHIADAISRLEDCFDATPSHH